MEPETRLELAFISISVRPYRTHLLRRVAAEIPGVALHSLFIRDWDVSRWTDPPPPSINPVHFGALVEDGERSGGVRRLVSDWQTGRDVVRYLDEHRIGAVILNGFGNSAFLRSLAACRRRGIPVFLRGDSNVRGDRMVGPVGVAKRAVVRWAVRRSTAVMPMGQLGQAFFERYGASASGCFWVPCEPDYGEFARPDLESLEESIVTHGLDRHRRRMLFAGRLVAAKRVDLAIDAFCRMAEARPEWDLVIAGDGPLAPELRGRVPRSLGNRVQWLGLVPPMAMRTIYSTSDLLLLPSEFEPWGLVVNEAVGAGLPVVASDVVGAAHELVTDRLSGRIFPSGDVDRLVECLLDVTDPIRFSLYQAAAPAALERWRARADPVVGIRNALQSAGLIQ